MLDWIKQHFSKLHDLQLNTLVTDEQGKVLKLDQGFKSYINIVKTIRTNHSKLIFIGNGGSAGIASHLSTDYSKNGNLPSLAFSDASAITCLSNDYGYEFVFSKQMEYHAKKNDVLIAISSSGKSPSILNAVAVAKKIGCKVLTFSGFDEKNPLRHQGDVNFFIASPEYGFVEVAHLALGHAMLDYIIEDDHKQQTIQQQTALEPELAE